MWLLRPLEVAQLMQDAQRRPFLLFGDLSGMFFTPLRAFRLEVFALLR